MPRELRDFVDPLHGRTGPHLPPARAHLRAAKEDYHAQAPPGAPFVRKLAAFLQNQFFAWLISYVKFRFGPRHKFQTYENTGDSGVYPLTATSKDEPIRVSIAGDWATGTDESERIARLMEGFRPHYTVHIGDVYYVGDEGEVRANCLGEVAPGDDQRGVCWPIGSVGSFAMNGNHEMYANGNAYFDVFLPKLGVRAKPGGPPAGQKASYFCLRNEHWDVLAVDTGYNSVGLPLLEKLPWFRPSCALRDELLQWLRATVHPGEGDRGIVLLSHQQYFSAFEDIFPKPAEQLAEFIKRPVLWIWGHEHRFAVYGKSRMGNGIEAFGRCVGHGGMPVDIGFPVKLTDYPLVLHDDRVYETVNETKVGFNGIANLTFQANRLTVEHVDINNRCVLREAWEVSGGNLVGVDITTPIDDPGLIKSTDLNIAIGKQ